MEEHTENSAEQGNNSDTIPPVSLGKMLRDARESLGLSVAEVADQIKFAPRQIEALEADDYRRLPELAFLRGFVRSYAKILNRDAQILLAALPEAKVAAAELMPAAVGVPFPVGQSSQKQNLILLGAALFLAVIAVGFAVWHFTTPLQQTSKAAKVETMVPLPTEIQTMPVPIATKQNTIAPSIADESKQPSSTKMEQLSVHAAKSTVAQNDSRTQLLDSGTHQHTAESTRLNLVFDQESWTEITDKDGKILSSKVNPRGSELNLEARPPLSLVIGHAATTHLYQDGEPIDLTPYINSSSEVARLTLE